MSNRNLDSPCRAHTVAAAEVALKLARRPGATGHRIVCSDGWASQCNPLDLPKHLTTACLRGMSTNT
jgi:hypothetical protein